MQFHKVEEVLIFGSRAKGNYKKSSDIDLALIGKEVDDTLSNHIHGILEDEIPLPYKFDIVNYAAISNPDFTDHIKRVGIVFYKKQEHTIDQLPKKKQGNVPL